MVGMLLLRGMLVGLVAGLLTFAFLKVAGEPQVDRAIAFESQLGEAKTKAAADEAQAKGMSMPVMSMPARADEEELVSRPVQSGIGLFTGVIVYCASLGGLFALAFAVVHGRMGRAGPRATSALLAAAAFVALSLLPNLKYPASPPSVGDAETIGARTALYFALIALSLATMIIAALLRNRLVRSQGGWNASLWAGAFYVVVMTGISLVMPSVNEVPEQFPAVTLWSFRVSSLGAQVIMWTTIGLLFGALTQRVAIGQTAVRLGSAPI